MASRSTSHDEVSAVRDRGQPSGTIRLVRLDDAPVLAELLRINREFLAPFEPIRDDDYFTAAGHRKVIHAALERHEQGASLPEVILDESGHVVGRITLNEIVRGPLQSCSLGYWVGADDNGRGLATAAVQDIILVAFEELGLHRLQAGTLLHNVRSQRVLERNGFVRYGLAPAYLNIAGEWQDHAMYQVATTAALANAATDGATRTCNGAPLRRRRSVQTSRGGTVCMFEWSLHEMRRVGPWVSGPSSYP